MDSFLGQLTDGGHQVNPTTHQTLFAGGFIDGGTGNDLDLDKKIRTLIPGLSVLGTAKPRGLFGSKDSQMLTGRINIGGAYLVCLETAHYIYNSFPAAIPYDCLQAIKEISEASEDLERSRIDSWLNGGTAAITEKHTTYRELVAYWLPLLEEKLKGYTQHLTWRQQTRQDSLKSPELAKHLLPEHQEGQLSLLGGEEKGKKEEKKSQQMIMGDWLLQNGSTLYSRCDAHITNIEEGYIVDALLKFAESPYLGGKGNTGCGLVDFQIYWRQGDRGGQYLTIDSTTQLLSDRAKSSHERYRAYLDEYRSYLAEKSPAIAGFLS
jgi:hypothetical protein